MLDLNFIRENKQKIINRLAVKNFDAKEIINNILTLDNKRKSTQKTLDDKQSEINTISKEIGYLFKQGKSDKADAAKQKTTKLKTSVKLLSRELKETEQSIRELLIQVPNVPHERVPKGKGEQDNVIVKSCGRTPDLPEDALPHWDLARQYDIIDFELGNKLTGAGFPVYKNKGAKLQRALISFFLDEAIKAGYHEVLPPLMVNEDSGFGTGQLPDKEGQMYHIPSDNYYLIPTAEVPAINMYRDIILDAEKFPVKITAYTPCFRREAGSWGKDVRGLNRLHQFDKVEIVQIQHPERSYETLEEMKQYVGELIRKLGLQYRIQILCGGDISFTSSLTYDFEVFAAAQEKWLEVSSVSNCESFQSNRLKLRFKEKGVKKTKLAHTLNGSALALPRIMAALLENNQTRRGIKIPGILTNYTDFELID
jgi:seryl-tRNA synthetase